jgi:hypothetical protein
VRIHAKGHNRTHAAQQIKVLFDHLVSAREQRRRDVEAERLRRLEVDHHFEFGRLHDREIASLRALENAAAFGPELTSRDALIRHSTLLNDGAPSLGLWRSGSETNNIRIDFRFAADDAARIRAAALELLALR